MANKICPKEGCPVVGTCEKDIVSNSLAKVGVCRSMLITLALLPFSWEGVVWFASAFKSIWDAATTAVG